MKKETIQLISIIVVCVIVVILPVIAIMYNVSVYVYAPIEIMILPVLAVLMMKYLKG